MPQLSGGDDTVRGVIQICPAPIDSLGFNTTTQYNNGVTVGELFWGKRRISGFQRLCDGLNPELS